MAKEKKEQLGVLDPSTTAKEYFEKLKSKKKKATNADLQTIYDNCVYLLEKYKVTGQTDAMKKLIFHLETIEKEKKLIEKGIDTFVYLTDIKDYIEKVDSRVVKIIELSRYEREVPDEIVGRIPDLKPFFHSFFVVFTDYTEEHVDKHKRETDPILFGMFKDEVSASVVERMYYIGDWVDEYCDLTLDQMVGEMKAVTGNNIERRIRMPLDLEDLKKQLNSLQRVDSSHWSITQSTSAVVALDVSGKVQTEKKSFTQWAKALFSKKK